MIKYQAVLLFCDHTDNNSLLHVGEYDLPEEAAVALRQAALNWFDATGDLRTLMPVNCETPTYYTREGFKAELAELNMLSEFRFADPEISLQPAIGLINR